MIQQKLRKEFNERTDDKRQTEKLQVDWRLSDPVADDDARPLWHLLFFFCFISRNVRAQALMKTHRGQCEVKRWVVSGLLGSVRQALGKFCFYQGFWTFLQVKFKTFYDFAYERLRPISLPNSHPCGRRISNTLALLTNLPFTEIFKAKLVVT